MITCKISKHKDGDSKFFSSTKILFWQKINKLGSYINPDISDITITFYENMISMQVYYGFGKSRKYEFSITPSAPGEEIDNFEKQALNDVYKAIKRITKLYFYQLYPANISKLSCTSQLCFREQEITSTSDDINKEQVDALLNLVSQKETEKISVITLQLTKSDFYYRIDYSNPDSVKKALRFFPTMVGSEQEIQQIRSNKLARSSFKKTQTHTDHQFLLLNPKSASKACVVQ